MRLPITLLVALLELALAGGVHAQQQADRWESAIRAFEKQDELHPPSKQAVLFVGSSSIRRWDLGKSFPGLVTINRGFGGSQLADSVRYAERLILKHEPRVVVVYAGDNDLAQGKSPEQVCADFQALVAEIHGQLPHTKIIYIAVKPSIKRWNIVAQGREANRLIRAVTDGDERLGFLDIQQAMLGADGTPRKELFVADGLHLSDEGYKLWAAMLGPQLAVDR